MAATMAPQPGVTSWEQALIQCARICEECAAACHACAEKCALEPDVVELARCMRMDLDCAEVARTTSHYLIRSGDDRPGLLMALLRACAIACAETAGECELHDHQHCRSCAAACRRAETECLDLLNRLT